LTFIVPGAVVGVRVGIVATVGAIVGATTRVAVGASVGAGVGIGVATGAGTMMRVGVETKSDAGSELQPTSPTVANAIKHHRIGDIASPQWLSYAIAAKKATAQPFVTVLYAREKLKVPILRRAEPRPRNQSRHLYEQLQTFHQIRGGENDKSQNDDPEGEAG
jgi:hypothetical protein